VLGQVAKGVRAADLRVGMEMQVAVEVLSHDEDHDALVYVWEPTGASGREPGIPASSERPMVAGASGDESGTT
jgi:hypothetical protein